MEWPRVHLPRDPVNIQILLLYITIKWFNFVVSPNLCHSYMDSCTDEACQIIFWVGGGGIIYSSPQLGI